MKRAIVRFRTGALLLAFLLATVFASVIAQAQMPRTTAEIPYAFTLPASNKPLAAGTYTISISQDGNFVTLASKTGETARQMILIKLSGPDTFLQEGTLVFDDTDGRHILSEVWLPGGRNAALVYSVPKGHTRAYLTFSALPATGQVSGKTAYERTCARCHGEGGNGDASADRHLGTVPRLNSALVQSKSDAELKTIISTGTTNMPPVEIEESGFRHRLPSQYVDAVVAYVRTLK
jgi:mono/diheme cytochrome c family protein